MGLGGGKTKPIGAGGLEQVLVCGRTLGLAVGFAGGAHGDRDR
jgi:hypothetical protein